MIAIISLMLKHQTQVHEKQHRTQNQGQRHSYAIVTQSPNRCHDDRDGDDQRIGRVFPNDGFNTNEPCMIADSSLRQSANIVVRINDVMDFAH